MPDVSAAAVRIIELTNALRRTHHLPDVKADPQLANAARYFADFMARTDKFAHTADGNQPAVRARKFGYDFCVVAENIAYEFSTAGFNAAELARNLVQGWENSAGHRKNMLDPYVTQTAVALSFSARTSRYYAVQMFGRPQSESIKFSVANRAGIPVEYQIDDQAFALPPLATRTHQICRRPQLRFRGETLRPLDSQRLVIVNEQGSVRLQVQ
ncbi:MAG: CAP domain-containing protein [Burkholderiaceae bacterium]|nr:CAP domain-containing protein [Burkholderiaceae bacterium]